MELSQLNVKLLTNGNLNGNVCMPIYYRLSFLFHLIVYENDWVEKWYWKVLGGGGILLLVFAAIMGY